jgi:lipopolysaccharide transport system ATP-binding protein
MAGDVIIRAEGLGKKYIIGHQTERERYTTLREVIARTGRTMWKRAVEAARGRTILYGEMTEEFWALKDVSFEVKRGEVLGIIGRNGAGKSTLLKILSRITEPSEGRVTIAGRVASLLEVGTGFHPELTGRENIFLNGAILGMSRAEIRRKFEEIVAFAEVGPFLDTPVKRFSSGMYVRLAFAVAAHLDPEILIIDEVLAVGDAEFQKKCLGKMSEVAGAGRTVLFVSHNMAAVEALCPRSIHLATTVVQVGETDRVVASYLALSTARSLFGEQHLTAIKGGLVLERVRIVPSAIPSGDSAHLEFPFRTESDGWIRECAILIYSAKGVRVAIVDVRECGAVPFKHQAGRFTIRAQIAALPVVEGSYTLGLWLVTDDFAGTLLELEHFTVGSTRWSHSFAPYAAEYRGVVVLQAESAVVVDHQAEVA